MELIPIFSLESIFMENIIGTVDTIVFRTICSAFQSNIHSILSQMHCKSVIAEQH
jgi:hypothetical protein